MQTKDGCNHIVMIILMCMFLSGLYLSTNILLASSQVGSPPLDQIAGFVLDENGHQVSNAVVTVWQDGQLWQPGSAINPENRNPQTSGFYEGREGSFLFSPFYPGEYTLTAEKQGYRGSANVSVTSVIVHLPFVVNITLNGYNSSLSNEQISYNGTVVGTLRSDFGSHVTGVVISLWKDGQLVDIPENPQPSSARTYAGAEVDYAFAHVAPGQYVVMAEYNTADRYNDNLSVNVSSGTVTADIHLTRLHSPPTQIPVETVIPAPLVTPVPSANLAMVLISLGIATLFICFFRKTR